MIAIASKILVLANERRWPETHYMRRLAFRLDRAMYDFMNDIPGNKGPIAIGHVVATARREWRKHTGGSL